MFPAAPRPKADGCPAKAENAPPPPLPLPPAVVFVEAGAEPPPPKAEGPEPLNALNAPEAGLIIEDAP